MPQLPQIPIRHDQPEGEGLVDLVLDVVEAVEDRPLLAQRDDVLLWPRGVFRSGRHLVTLITMVLSMATSRRPVHPEASE
jgi:hypothetical protein